MRVNVNCIILYFYAILDYRILSLDIKVPHSISTSYNPIALCCCLAVMIIVFWWFGASRESAHHAHGHGMVLSVEFAPSASRSSRLPRPRDGRHLNRPQVQTDRYGECVLGTVSQSSVEDRRISMLSACDHCCAGALPCA
jgi:hypothetical protein